MSGTITVPPSCNGFGTLAATNASAALSTLTVGPGSNLWLMPFNGTLYIKNSAASADNVYVCPLGGTCSATVGIPLAPGEAYGFNLGGSTTSPTVFATSTATVVAQW